MSNGILIIGAGQAAAQFAISLRQSGYTNPIRMVGDEPYAPYQRPPLSKAFLKEKSPPADKLLLRREGFWADQKVQLELNTRATAIHLETKQVEFADGHSVPWEILVFATGTRARELPVPGVGLPGVFSLRKIDDVRRLRPALDTARRIVIVGAGYIGLEVAAVLRQEGRDATVIEAEDRVMKRVVGEPVSAFFEALHRLRGVDIRLGARLVAIEGETRATGVRLALGEIIVADLVLVATGARPNDDLAATIGHWIKPGEGIYVNSLTHQMFPCVLAIGDCAQFHSHRYDRRIRLECVQNAIDHAKAAAATVVGPLTKYYDPVPWFWSDQYETKLQSAGLLEGYDTAEIVGDPAEGRFSVDYRKNDLLIAVDAVNDGRAHMLGRMRIEANLPETPWRLD
jgi:3-phenylpropionate/trans-cinnamate dioxygenase ferredoxin reductase subunit